jgi:hypothetical protein
MTWTLVQKSSAPGTNSAGSPAVPSLGSASTAGNLLVAVVTDADEADTVTAPSGWLSAVLATQAFAGSAGIWYYPDNPGGITSASFAASGSNIDDTWLAEFTAPGVAAAMLDSAGAGTASAADCTVTATSASAAGDLAVCIFGMTATGNTWSPVAGFTLIGDDSGMSFGTAWAGYLLSAAGGTLAVTGHSNLSGEWAGAVATFSASGVTAVRTGAFAAFFA